MQQAAMKCVFWHLFIIASVKNVPMLTPVHHDINTTRCCKCHLSNLIIVKKHVIGLGYVLNKYYQLIDQYCTNRYCIFSIGNVDYMSL